MKLPTNIKTRHKIRDLAIIKSHVNDGESYEEIAEKHGISRQRVYQVIFANRHLIDWDKSVEKARRINHLKKLLSDNPERIGNNTTLDMLEQLRKEIDGDKPLVDNSQHLHITSVVAFRNPEALKEENASTNRIQA